MRDKKKYRVKHKGVLYEDIGGKIEPIGNVPEEGVKIEDMEEARKKAQELRENEMIDLNYKRAMEADNEKERQRHIKKGDRLRNKYAALRKYLKSNK